MRLRKNGVEQLALPADRVPFLAAGIVPDEPSTASSTIQTPLICYNGIDIAFCKLLALVVRQKSGSQVHELSTSSTVVGTMAAYSYIEVLHSSRKIALHSKLAC